MKKKGFPSGKIALGTFLKFAAAFVALLGAGLVVWYFGFFSSLNNYTQTRIVNVEQMAEVKRVTVNMQGVWKGEDKREDYITETLKEFEIRNPDIKVNLKWTGDFEGGREGAIDAAISQFKTGKIDWDIIWLEPSYYQEIARSLKDPNWARRFLVDFEQIPVFGDTQKPFIITDPQYRNQMNGVITGPHIEGFYQPFFYNRELADKVGIDIKQSGMTFDDLLEYFKKIDEYNRANGTKIAALYDSGDYKGGIGYAPSVFNIFQSLFRSEFSSLAEVQDTQHSDAKMRALKKVLGSLEQLSEYKPLISGWKDLNWFDTRDYVLNNKAVFTAAGASWLYSHWHGIDANATMKMVPVEMPVYKSVNHYMGGYNPIFAVAKDSPARDEAVKLLMAFATPNAAEKWVRYSKEPSGIKGNISTAGKVSESADQFDRFIAYITGKYVGNVFDSKTVDYVLGDKYQDLTVNFCMHLADVMDGKKTADQAYKAIVADMKSLDEGKNVIIN